jgi:hypothetical protein
MHDIPNDKGGKILKTKGCFGHIILVILCLSFVFAVPVEAGKKKAPPKPKIKNGLNHRVARLELQVRKLGAAYIILRRDVAALKLDTRRLKAEIIRLWRNVNYLKHSVAELKTDMARLKPAVRRLSYDVNILKQNVAALETALAVETTNRMDADQDLQGQINDLDSEIMNLNVPIAFATVAKNSTKLSGTSNVSVVLGDIEDCYKITIGVETYTWESYTANASLVVDDSAIPAVRIATGDDSGGNLTVCTYDIDGNKVQGAFQVVVYKMP